MDFPALIDALADVDPKRGLYLIDARFRETFYPWRAMHARVRAQARNFEAQGLRQGQRVLIPLATDIDAIASFLAIVRLGAVPFSVTAPLLGQDREAHRRQMIRLITTHGVHRLIVSDDLAGIAGSSAEAPAEMALAMARPSDGDLADTTPLPHVEAAPGDTAFVQFSSGSTAAPKGVQITHGGLLHNLHIINANDGRTADSVMVSWLPLYHDMGMVGCLLSNFIHGNDLVLMHPRAFMLRPIAWLAAITRHGGTVTAIPNFALDLCTDRITDEELAASPIDLSTFRYIYDGSEPVRPASIRRFEERFRPYGYVPGSTYPVYGMAEATLIVTAPRRDEPEVVRCVEGMDVPSVGYPLADFGVEIRDDDGRVLPPETIGELHLKGLSITPGYLDPTGETAGLIRDGWLATGDLGMRDADGRVYITGRKKDLLIVQGRNFYGHDVAACIEEVIGSRTGSAYVFAHDDGARESVIAVVARPKGTDESEDDGAGPLKTEIRRTVLRELGLAIDDVVFVQRMPKTTSGKIVRHLVRQMYLDARA